MTDIRIEHPDPNRSRSDLLYTCTGPKMDRAVREDIREPMSMEGGDKLLYVAHFSFDEIVVSTGSAKDGPYHGYFALVAEANDVEEALNKFKALIIRLHRDEDILDDVQQVLLDSCVEIRSIPNAGFLVHYAMIDGECLGGIFTSIRGASEEEATAYDIQSPDEDGGVATYNIEPFVEFE